MVSLKSWSSGRFGRGGSGRIVRFWSSKDSSKLLRTDPRRGWVRLFDGVGLMVDPSLIPISSKRNGLCIGSDRI